jgi:hypothetical protein
MEVVPNRTVCTTEFISRYCERADIAVQELSIKLKEIVEVVKPKGFMLLENQVMDSSKFGSVSILAYGPNCAFKELVEGPFSFDGTASGTSQCISYLLVEDFNVDDL